MASPPFERHPYTFLDGSLLFDLDGIVAKLDLP
jgi:hypothetical protein